MPRRSTKRFSMKAYAVTGGFAVLAGLIAVSTALPAQNSPTCTETDGGHAPDVFGSIRAGGFGGNDHCESGYNGRLVEYSCSNGDFISEYVTCAYGCDQGACEPQGGSSCLRVTTESACNGAVRDGKNCKWNPYSLLCEETSGNGNIGSCRDSDGGEKYSVQGMVSDAGGGYNDHCQNVSDPASPLYEYFCSRDGGMAVREVQCPNGCVNGKCLAPGEPSSSASSSSARSSSAPSSAARSSAASSWTAPECSNGRDDNDDGHTDMADPSCKSPSQTREGWIERCTDSDGGQLAEKQGTTLGYEVPNVVAAFTDRCGIYGNQAGKLVEFSCRSDHYVDMALIPCPDGCIDGACIKQTTTSQKPDLTVQNLKFVKLEDGLAAIAFDVVNVGTAPTQDWFAMVLSIDGVPYHQAYYADQKNGTSYGEADAVIGIQPGGRKHIELGNYYWLENSASTLKLTADIVEPSLEMVSWFEGIMRNNMIDESNEYNNTAELRLTGSSHQPPASSAPASVGESEYEDVVRTAGGGQSRFTDIGMDTLEGKAANALAERGIIGGFPDKTFRGGNYVNRAEAAKFMLLARYGGVPDMRNNGLFPDVLPGEWYEKYVVYAAAMGIIRGHDDGYFRPADGVNTAELLKMMTLAFGLPTDLPYTYADVDAGAWFAPYAGLAQTYFLFPDRHAYYLDPSRALTREEVALALYRYMSAAGLL